mmetsp:Transcript_22961/g.35746  ORF Transcript_22961/g.35746 Transcript_22961/m.35746 type:complete len:81 (+) Transcript_22961:673-915(+)
MSKFKCHHNPKEIHKCYTKKLEALEMREVGGSTYEVEGIVDHRKEKPSGKIFYRIRWVGYPPSQDTWEVVENLRFAKQAV